MTTVVTAKFRLMRTTAGVLIYKEFDSNTGINYDAPNSPGCKIGQLYLRKSAIADRSHPTEIAVTVTID